MRPAANVCISPCTGSRSWPIRLLGSALEGYARYEYLYTPAKEDEELHGDQRKFLPVVIGYVIAILIGLALPAAAVAIYFGLAVYLVVPFREAARVLRRRRSSRKERRLRKAVASRLVSNNARGSSAG
jgi:hypothetical protein